MAIKRITMQELADACGLSRNTVSKVFNERGTVPEATKQLVLRKAEELGYMQFNVEKNVSAEESSGDSAFQKSGISKSALSAYSGKNVALLTKRIPNDYHFGSLFLPSFTERLSRAGVTLMMYEVKENEFEECCIPKHLVLDQTAGIITIEIFDKKYLEMLSGLGLPLLAVDAFAEADMSLLNFDFISMENIASTINLISHIISNGAKKLGFVGDINHCNSFHERFMGFIRALNKYGIPFEKEICILNDDSESYGSVEWFMTQIQSMPYKPDSFVCANDFIAINLLKAVKKMNLSVPDDIKIAGFDGILQSEVVEPPLTTIKIPGKEIGKMAADMLMERMVKPEKPFIRVYVNTTPIFRSST